jgi:tRNA dimethylallyltransferase
VETESEIVIVAGPTASGKSALASAVAAELAGTIINADSMQVYRDLPILTAQPDAAARARVPHRLYGEVDPAEGFSAGVWRERAVAAIAAARAAGRVPILCGGTGLYLRGLLEGLAPTPPIPSEVRQAAQRLRTELGAAAFHEELRRVDPEAAAKLDPADTQRVLRAYEVAVTTGRGLGEWQRMGGGEPGFAARIVLLIPPRDPLYAGCDARFLGMMAKGAGAEVAALLARRLDPALPAMRALGVRELAAWLRGDCSEREAVAAAQQATRNYAKRQVTWFRNQLQERESRRRLLIEEQFSERLLPEIFSFIRL